MFGKLSIVFLAILALQGTSGNQYRTQLEATDRGLIDEFEKIIKELSNVIENAINTAFEQLDALFDEIIKLAESISAGIVSSFETVMSKIKREIEELVEKAHELHIDVTECLGDNEDELMAIPQKLFDNTIACVNKEVDKAKQIIEDTKTEISKALNIIDEIWQEFKECSGISIGICWGRVILEATEKIVSVPLGIAKQAAAAAKLLATAKINLGLCQSKNIANATKDALILSGEITKCIIDKIGNVQ